MAWRTPFPGPLYLPTPRTRPHRALAVRPLRRRAERAEGGDQPHARAAEAERQPRGFGGVRIEDDVLCKKSGPDVLSKEVPKERVALEALIGSAC